MTALARPTALLALLLNGAIFGFFYAWVCSTMWGLDAADPRIAIPAMQAMNDSVRNAVFAPAFFATPFVLLLAAALCRTAARRSATLLGTAGLVYLLGGLLLTVSLNVPMNQTLATVQAPADLAEAQAIWQAYSPEWQRYNVIRTVASGAALLLTGLALMSWPTRAGGAAQTSA